MEKDTLNTNVGFQGSLVKLGRDKCVLTPAAPDRLRRGESDAQSKLWFWLYNH